MKSFFYNMLDIQPGICIVLALLIILRPWLKKHFSARARHILWLVVVIRFAVPVNIDFSSLDLPQIYVPLPRVNVYTEVQTGGSQQNTVITPDAEQPTVPDIPGSEIVISGDNALTFDELLMFIWLAGAVFQIIKRSGYIKEKEKLLKKIRYDEALDLLLEKISGRLAVDKYVKIAWCDYDGSPMLLSFFEPIILIPENGVKPEDLDIIITHELTHLKHNDVLFKFIINILECVYWYNPLVYLMSRYACEDIEFACDETVLAHQSDEYRADYAQSVLNNVAYSRSLILATNFTPGYETLKERFENIFSDKKMNFRTKAFAVILTVSATVTVFYAAISFGSIKIEKNDITEINDITVYMALKDDIKWNLRYGHVYPGSVYNMTAGFGGEASLITDNPDEICTADMLNSHSSPHEAGRLEITVRDNFGEKLGKSISFSTGMNWVGQLQAVGYENGTRAICRLYGVLPESEEKIVEDVSGFMAQAYGNSDIYLHKSYGNINLGLHYWDYSTGCVEILLMDNFYYSNWLDMIKQRQKYARESPYENTILPTDDFPSEFRDFREIYREDIYGGWLNGGGGYISKNAEKYFCYVNEDDEYKISYSQVVKGTNAPQEKLFTVNTITGDCGNGVSLSTTQRYDYNSPVVYQFIKDFCYMYNPAVDGRQFYNRFVSDIQNNQYNRYPGGHSEWTKEINGVFCSVDLYYNSISYDINDLSVGNIYVMDYALGRLYTVGPDGGYWDGNGNFNYT